MYNLRPQQQRAIDNLYHWWMKNPDGNPLIVQPTGAGKSIIIAELARLLFDTWPQDHPRTLVIVPSKELAEQNAEKLRALLPPTISLGFYSASLGRKQPDCDVIVATIGSVYKSAHLLGDIKCVIIDEAHLVNPDGKNSGRYRQLLSELSVICRYRIVGLTATPFRGNGVWLTAGSDPLFTGIADNCTITELLDAGFLAPLSLPSVEIKTQIDTSNVSKTGIDYNLKELSECTQRYLPAIVSEVLEIAKDRKKWIAFTPTIVDAEKFADSLIDHGITAAVVCGHTPKKEREQHIKDFHKGRIKCLVTVLALATGFDAPDVDCIVWLRTTISPVLYIQGAGRGLRIAAGKDDCLWLDFTDTTERLGPIDSIKGRNKRGKVDSDAPCIICENCGARVIPASTIICPECGHVMREDEQREFKEASQFAVLSNQLTSVINTYDVTRCEYRKHTKPGKPDSMRIDYFAGLRRVASEWICPFHAGFAGAKGFAWCDKNISAPPADITDLIDKSKTEALTPASIRVDESKKFPKIIRMEFS